MTGSIEKRGKNSYRLVVFKGYDLDGKPIRHQKTIHCKKKSEAQIELAKFLTEVESGLIVSNPAERVQPLKSHDRTAGNVLENLLISSKAN